MADEIEKAAAASIESDEEELFRQVHPTFWRDGRLTSAAFKPTKKDQQKLSVARGAATSAENAYRHHTQTLALRSEGSWVVTVGECRKLSLQVISDPLTSPPEPAADPAHAFLDYRGLSNGLTEKKSSELSRIANTRGRRFPPPPSVPPPADNNNT